MLTLTPPAALNGDLLARQLADAGLTTTVLLSDGQLVLPGLGESNRPAAQSVIDAHATTAQAASDQATTERTNETSIRDKAAAALDANKTFLAITSPTNAQIAAQVKALTRQNNALIRLALRRFDGTD